jgi:ubiquinone/menaquinone biosynthesis C-methylase UbiE
VEAILRALIYDLAVRPLTTRWYRQVLDRLPQGARLLDVGVGTAGALCGNAETLNAKDIRVVGVDIDADYVRQARKRVEDTGLADRVEVRLASILDVTEGGFDAAYFSASFMLMPDPGQVLRHVSGLLAPGGRIYFTQTFEERRSPFMERLKPLLHRLTTIHFGTVTYEEDFLRTVEGAGMKVLEHVKLSSGRARTGRLVVAVPASEAAGG